MRWIKDNTGRFAERPYYEREELESMSEELITGFLRETHGRASFPVSTEDLTILVENHTSDLDQYADLAHEGLDVEGVTLFFKDRAPAVKIAEHLANPGGHEHRLRTTLTHEFAHVKLHGFLWQFNQLSLFPEQNTGLGPRCQRVGILGTTQTDWMEWQAGYVSGALLMPFTSLNKLVGTAVGEWRAFGSVAMTSEEGQQLIRLVATEFEVSQEAARVRLAQRGVLAEEGPKISLF